MTVKPEPARLVPPGRIIRRELDAREWTQSDLAKIMGRPAQAVSQIIGGHKQITADTAVELGAAFGTSAELWSNLETNYRVRLAARTAESEAIARRSRLYDMLPISEMARKGWIKLSDNAEELENAVCRFLRVSSMEEAATAAAWCRGSRRKNASPAARLAWVRRVEDLAATQQVAPLSTRRLGDEGIPAVLRLSGRAQDAAKVAEALSQYGVHFVIVRHLQRTYLDGAAFPLDKSSVVALTLRYDRMDNFWFTLMHEIAHVVRNHSAAFLDNLDEAAVDSEERAANRMAEDWLIPRSEYRRFVRVTRPGFSGVRIRTFAASVDRHPAIVLGRLQSDCLVGWQNLKRLGEKMSPSLANQIEL